MSRCSMRPNKIEKSVLGSYRRALEVRGSKVFTRFLLWFQTVSPVCFLRSLAWCLGQVYCPPSKRVRFGDLRRRVPISGNFGLKRGLPVDRYYIENFLARHSADIRGRVLEIGNDIYTRKFGSGLVAKSDVLHLERGNPSVTIVGDLTKPEGVPSEEFDCVILTQTLHLIYDVRAAIANLKQCLKPGGVILATVPGISQICRYDMDRWGDYWRFTTLSIRRLFTESFPENSVDVESHGNVLVALSFLHGLVVDDLEKDELDYNDPDYETVITVRAVNAQVVL